MEQFFTNNESAIVVSNRILYTASEFARRSLLHLQEIGQLEAKQEHTSSREGLQSFLFFMVLSGEGQLTYGGKEYKLSPGACVFIDCRKPYSHRTGKKLWTIMWVHFYGPTASNIYEKYCERGGRPSFTPKSNSSVKKVWSQLMDTAASPDYMRDMKINTLLSDLLTLVMSESWHPEDKVPVSKKQSVLDVKEYLDNNYFEKITLDYLSEKFYISKYYLTHSFKEQFGISITSYLLNVRITKAKQLLRFSHKTVEEIGYDTGIGAPNYFSCVFKKVEGISPVMYREQW